MPDAKARLIVFDIETYRTTNPDAIDRIRDEAWNADPPRSAAKAVKEAWFTAEARNARIQEALDKTAVDPALAEIICLGLWACGTDPALGESLTSAITFDDIAIVPMFDRSADAAALYDLSHCLDRFTGSETIWAGHNITGFDLPILLNNWRRHDIRPPEHFPCLGYRGHWRGRIFDTMERSIAKTPFISLEDACRNVGLPSAKSIEWRGEPMTGARVAEAYAAEEFSLLAEYCATDVAAERALVMRLTANDTWGTWPNDTDLAEQFGEIDASSLSDLAKDAQKYRLLSAAGRIPVC